MSTTLDRDVAMQYAAGTGSGFVFEVKQRDGRPTESSCSHLLNLLYLISYNKVLTTNTTLTYTYYTYCTYCTYCTYYTYYTYCTYE